MFDTKLGCTLSRSNNSDVAYPVECEYLILSFGHAHEQVQRDYSIKTYKCTNTDMFFLWFAYTTRH